MLYKPQYCCQCGEKIERAAWHLWTSRKFCEICEIEFPAHRWLPPALGATAAASLVFGFGAYLKTNERASVAEASRTATTAAGKTAGNQKNAPLSTTNAVQNGGVNQNDAPAFARASPAAESSSDPAQAKNLRLLKAGNPQTGARAAVYYCGAQTKKGTPCTRRVKSGGKRCWQHEGQPALPPPEKPVAR